MCLTHTRAHNLANITISGHKAKRDAPFSASLLVAYALELSNFYTDYCKLLKFIEYWEQNVISSIK